MPTKFEQFVLIWLTALGMGANAFMFVHVSSMLLEAM